MGKPHFARVCVEPPLEGVGPIAQKTKSHDGVAVPPRGRVRCTRRDRFRSTTNYILVLVSSSIGRENKYNLRIGGGGVYV